MTTTATATPTATDAKERTGTMITDAAGKRWEMVLTVGQFKPLEKVLGHHPRRLVTEPNTLIGLLADTEKLVAVAHLLLPPASHGVPPVPLDVFAADFDAEALDQAAEAVIRLACGFFAPRGAGPRVADSIIGTLKEAAEGMARRAEAAGGDPATPPAPAVGDSSGGQVATG